MAEAKFFNVHWDGKMLADFQGGGKKVDRLPVIVTYDGNEQLLGVPKIPSGKGKGKRIAEAVYDLLLEWKIAERVQAISFDTTSTNTGQFQGASVLLEQILERDLFYLPCRHHIYELQLKEVFEAKFGKTSGPGVPMFARFKEQWENVTDKPYSSGIEDDGVAAKIPVRVQTEIKSFCLAQLTEKQPRDDYKEFLEIVLLFLGENIPNYYMRPPGPTSHARWMAKGIYCIKMFLYRKYLRLNLTEFDGLRDVTIFIVTLYVKAWFSTTRAAEAPNNDLNFLKALAGYASIDEIVSKRLVKRFCAHLWYLSGEAVALALFDPNVHCDIKQKIATVIRVFEEEKEAWEEEELSDDEMDESSDEDSEKEGDVDDIEEDDLEDSGESGNQYPAPPVHVVGFKGVKRIILTSKQVNQKLLMKDLSDYVTPETANFFKRFGLSTDFIVTYPETWEEREDYQQALEIIRKLHVVNDAAERGVKLIGDYNNLLCCNDEEQIFLLQVVAENRKKYPSYTKNKLIL